MDIGDHDDDVMVEDDDNVDKQEEIRRYSRRRLI
jgi:hypothetical protein